MFEKFTKQITQEKTDKEIAIKFLSDSDAKEQILELTNKIKDNESKEKVFKMVVDECENDKISDAIIRIINQNIKPYEEMSYFRELDLSKFKSIIEYMFDNTLITTESKDIIIEKTNLDENNFKYALRLLNTVNSYIVLKRFTQNRFKTAIYDLFRFGKDKIDFLWELFNHNKQTLVTIAILNNISLCRDISDDLANLLKVFTEFSNEDDEE